MKKLLATFLIALASSAIVLAQQRSNVEFGAEIGYNSSYVTAGSSNFNSSTIGSFNAGVSADYYFSDRWSLKAKVIFDQKGWGNGFYINAAGVETDNVDYQLNYLTIPLTANWHFGAARDWYLNFGPYAGFLLSANESTNNYNVKDSFSTTDAGIDLGIGVKFPMTNNLKFFMEYDGQGGVTNILAKGSGSNFQNIRGSFNIGLNF